MASSVPPEPDTFDPVLIHGAGIAVWGNRAFIERFGVDPAAIKRLKVRELLWSLGLQDPLARIIAEGAIFTDLVAADWHALG